MGGLTKERAFKAPLISEASLLALINCIWTLASDHDGYKNGKLEGLEAFEDNNTAVVEFYILENIEIIEYKPCYLYL